MFRFIYVFCGLESRIVVMETFGATILVPYTILASVLEIISSQSFDNYPNPVLVRLGFEANFTWNYQPPNEFIEYQWFFTNETGTTEEFIMYYTSGSSGPVYNDMSYKDRLFRMPDHNCGITLLNISDTDFGEYSVLVLLSSGVDISAISNISLENVSNIYRKEAEYIVNDKAYFPNDKIMLPDITTIKVEVKFGDRLPTAKVSMTSSDKTLEHCDRVLASGTCQKSVATDAITGDFLVIRIEPFSYQDIVNISFEVGSPNSTGEFLVEKILPPCLEVVLTVAICVVVFVHEALRSVKTLWSVVAFAGIVPVIIIMTVTLAVSSHWQGTEHRHVILAINLVFGLVCITVLLIVGSAKHMKSTGCCNGTDKHGSLSGGKNRTTPPNINDAKPDTCPSNGHKASFTTTDAHTGNGTQATQATPVSENHHTTFASG